MNDKKMTSGKDCTCNHKANEKCNCKGSQCCCPSGSMKKTSTEKEQTKMGKKE